MTKSLMGQAKAIQCSFLLLITRAGIELGGDYCTEDGTLKDAMVIT
jgi:hypothetical protein